MKNLWYLNEELFMLSIFDCRVEKQKTYGKELRRQRKHNEQ